MDNFIKNNKIMEVKAPIAAASDTDSNTDVVDTTGFGKVTFIVPITDSADTGVATMTIEQNTLNSATGMAALTGASATATSAANDDLNGTLLIVEVDRPLERYVQAALTSATANIAYGNTIAILSDPISMPITEDTTVSDSAVVVGPAEA